MAFLTFTIYLACLAGGGGRLQGLKLIVSPAFDLSRRGFKSEKNIGTEIEVERASASS